MFTKNRGHKSHKLNWEEVKEGTQGDFMSKCCFYPLQVRRTAMGKTRGEKCEYGPQFVAETSRLEPMKEGEIWDSTKKPPTDFNVHVSASAARI